jgi:hypothetical protein
MRNRARSIIALTLVATTLCAARLFASGPNAGPESRLPSEKLVARLTRSISRTMGRNALQHPQLVQRPMACAATTAPVLVSIDRPHSTALDPFQYRLPPPLL